MTASTDNGRVGTDHGTGPATSVSPDYLASEISRPSGWSGSEPDDKSEDAAAIGIEDIFRRKLAALRRMSRHDRPHALRAAREERLLALKALRDKRAWRRQADRMLRKALMPALG